MTGLATTGRAEAIGLPDDPAAQDAPAAAPGDEEVLLVNEATLDQRIDTRHEIVVVVARVGVVDQIAELLPVAGAAPGVGEQDHIAGGGVQLDLRGEAVAVVGEGATVYLEQKGVLLRAVESRWIGDPSLHAAPVMRRVVPDLLDTGKLLAREEVRVEIGNMANGGVTTLPGADIGGAVAVGEGRRIPPVGSHGVGAAGVGPADRRSDMLGEHLDLALEVHEGEPGVPLVIVQEEQSIPLDAPAQTADVSIEPATDHPGLRPVPAHDMESCYLIPLSPVIETEIGNRSTVRGDDRVLVGSAPVCQGDRPSIGHPDFVHLGVTRIQIPFRVTVGRDYQRLPIGGPRGSRVVVEGGRS